MRVGLDATPLLGAATGVGRYVAGVRCGLRAASVELEVVPVAFTWRGADGFAGRRVPARALRAAWTRIDWPPVEWLAGAVDVFHGTNFVQPPARRAAGVVTVHDLAYLRFPDTVSRASAAYRSLVPRSLGRAALVCTPSHAVASELADVYRLPADRIVVTPLGVADAYRQARPPTGADRSRLGLPERYLVFVGNREPRKNLPGLVEALRRLHAADRGTPPLCLVGPPGWGRALDLTGLPDGAVAVVGYVPELDLPTVIAGAAALALPSKYEGFGLPALEALACGTAVVASDIPAVREVAEGVATLVPVDDPDALAAGLARELAAPPDGTARAARRARAAEFTWECCGRRTLEAYQRAAAR